VEQYFYSDLPIEEARIWARMLTQQGTQSVIYEAATGKPWAKIPVLWIRTDKDQAYPPEAQNAAIEMMRENGANIEVVGLPTSHSPFLSAPSDFFSVIQEYLLKIESKSY
jgi:pimeloyl-ACP methyl ester carboxylesterase